MLANSITIFRLNRILNFKVLFCDGRKLLRKVLSLCRQLFLHFFQFVQVTAKALSFAVVLAVEVMQNHSLTAAEDADAYADYLMSLSQAGQLNEQKTMKKELDATQRRLSELATLVQRIYEDNVFGQLSDDLYQTLSAKYEAETKELKTRAAEIQALLTEATIKTQGI